MLKIRKRSRLGRAHIKRLALPAELFWQAADGETPLSDIVEGTVCRQFDVAPQLAYQDAEALVSDLAGHGILLVSEQPISTQAPQEPR